MTSRSVAVIGFFLGVGASCVTERGVERAIEDARYCDVDADCVVIYGECPFGCWFAINSSEVDDIQRRMERYRNQQIGGQCAYDCAGVSEPYCQASVCMVDPVF